jgi:hypothetical protein
VLPTLDVASPSKLANVFDVAFDDPPLARIPQIFIERPKTVDAEVELCLTELSGEIEEPGIHMVTFVEMWISTSLAWPLSIRRSSHLIAGFRNRRLSAAQRDVSKIGREAGQFILEHRRLVPLGFGRESAVGKAAVGCSVPLGENGIALDLTAVVGIADLTLQIAEVTEADIEGKRLVEGGLLSPLLDDLQKAGHFPFPKPVEMNAQARLATLGSITGAASLDGLAFEEFAADVIHRGRVKDLFHCVDLNVQRTAIWRRQVIGRDAAETRLSICGVV